MSKHRNYSSGTSFLDLLFNSLLAFVAFFMISLMLINEDAESKPSVVQKVEFMITMTWDSGNSDDVDIWMVDPLENIVYFNRKEDGLMHLDRDDVGTKNDTIKLPDGTIYKYKENREVINVRGIVPGEYVVNVHMFVKRDPGPVMVNVKLEKMNPYNTVYVKDIKLVNHGDEATAIRFRVNQNGDISSVSDGPPRKLIKQKGQ